MIRLPREPRGSKSAASAEGAVRPDRIPPSLGTAPPKCAAPSLTRRSPQDSGERRASRPREWPRDVGIQRVADNIGRIITVAGTVCLDEWTCDTAHVSAPRRSPGSSISSLGHRFWLVRVRRGGGRTHDRSHAAETQAMAGGEIRASARQRVEGVHPPVREEADTHSTNSTPFSPSATVGNAAALRSNRPPRAARTARLTSL